MRHVVLCVCLAFASVLQAQPEIALSKIAEGRAALAAHDLPLARTKFTEARAADATNQTAAALLGLTRWFALAGDAPAQSVLTGAGVAATGRDIYGWTARLTENEAGDGYALASGYNIESQRVFWRDTVVATSAAVRSDLAAVTNENFVLVLSAAEVGGTADVTLDRGDLLLCQASLRAFEMVVNFFLGQNFDADAAELLELANGNLLTLRRALDANPNLFKAGPLEHRLAAKAALLDFISLYRTASAVVRARPAGVDRLFMLEGDADLKDEADFRLYLNDVQNSLLGYVGVDAGSIHVSLAPLATAEWSLRGSLPAMTDGKFDPAAIGDATIGLVVLGLPRERFANVLVDAGYSADLGWEPVNPVPVGQLMRSYVHTGVKHLVGGTGGLVGTSSDGATWSYRNVTGAQDFLGFALGAGKVVAIGQTQFWVSADHGATWKLTGQAWKGADHEGLGSLVDLIFDGSKFLAASSGGFLWQSMDGTHWKRAGRIQSGTVQLTPSTLEFSGGRYVSTGVATVQGSSRPTIFTSTDGLQWAYAFSGASGGGRYSSLAAGNGRWVAGAAVGRVAYSLDGGATWAEITVGASTDSFSVAGFADGMFVIGGSARPIGTSTDAIHWDFSVPETGSSSFNFYSATPGPGGLYLTGPLGRLYRYAGRVATRVDANQHALPGNVTFGPSVVFNGKLYTTASDGSVLESSDGLSFTPRSTSTTNPLGALVVHQGQLFAAGSAGTIVSSADGVNWQTRVTNDATLTQSSISVLVSVNGRLIAAGSLGAALLTSVDGIAWTRRTLPVSAAVNAIAYGGGYYVAGITGAVVTNGGYTETAILYSSDAITWTRQVVAYALIDSDPTSSSAPAVRSVTHYQGEFIVAATSGRVLRSSYGGPQSYWEEVASLAGSPLGGARQDSVLLQHTLRARADARSTLAYSLDGEAWVQSDLPDTLSFNAPVVFGDRVYLFNAGGTFYRSRPMVFAPPAASGLASGQTGVVGGSITLGAAFTASESLDYQWSFGGVPITGATGPTLTLSSLQTGQGGAYTVTATGQQTRTSATTSVTLTVANGAPIITQQPAGGTAVVGGSFKLGVTASGSGSLTYRWFKGNAAVPGATASTLVLTPVTTGDAGIYRVEVSNATGTTVSAEAPLAVNASGAVPAFWDDSESILSPSRLIHDNQGRFYATWNITLRNQDVVGGVAAGSLARFFETTGAVDPSFAWDERLGSPLFVCIQADGKLLVAVSHGAGEGCTVVRVNADGSHDGSYVAPRFSRSARFMTLQSDGRLIITATDSVGTSSLPSGAINVVNPTVYRLLANGALDTGFAPVDIGSTATIFAPPVVDSSGRIYLAGTFTTVNGSAQRAIARVSSSGVLDPAFANPSAMPAGWSTASHIGRGVGIQSDGKVIAVGRFAYTARGNTSTDPIVAVRFNATGEFDATFAQPLRSQLQVASPFGVAFYARFLLMTANDKFYMNFDRVLRFNANGSLDTTWLGGQTGYNNGFSKELFWLSRSPVTGNLFVPDLPDPEASGSIACIAPDGSRVTSFNVGGFGTTQSPDGAIVLADGRLLAGGDFDHFGALRLPGTALFGANGLPAGDSTAFHDPTVPSTDPHTQVFQWPDLSFGVVRADGGDPVTGEGWSVTIDRFNADGTPRRDWNLEENSIASWLYASTPDGGLFTWRPYPQSSTILTDAGAWYGRRFGADGGLAAGNKLDLSSFLRINRLANNTVSSVDYSQLIDLQVALDGSTYALIAGLDGNVALRRFTPQGTLDAAYSVVALAPAVAAATSYSSFVYDPVTGTSVQYALNARQFNEPIRFALLPDGGAWVIGKLTISGSPRTLVRLTPSGAVDSTVADLTLGSTHPLGLGPRVTGLTLDDSGRVYVAGRFDSANGTPVPGLLRLNRDGTLDSAWSPGLAVSDQFAVGAELVAGRGWLHVLGPVKAAGESHSSGYQRVAITPTPPVLVNQSASRTLNAGQSLQLFAGILGGGDMTYQWTRNGSALLTPNSALLDLGVAHSGLAGTYVLTATNSLGTVSTTAMVVTVSSLPVITVQPQPLTLTEGGSATFSVTATSNTTLNYQWKLNGTDIPGATSATYVIPAVVAATHAGSYTVVVANAEGSAASSAALLTVNAGPVAPVMTQQPVGFTATPGYTITLGVTVTAPPGASITSYRWYQNGTLFTTTSTSSLTSTLNPSAPITVANSYYVVVTASNGGTVTSNTATITPATTNYAFSSLAGFNTRGSADGTGANARFTNPNGVAVDSAGNAYIADLGNHTVRRISSTGVVTTVAGQAGVNSLVDGAVSTARFSTPAGIVAASNGDLYIIQAGAIRKISGGTVSTLAGSTSLSAADGTGTAARFNNACRGVIDPSGNLFVADQFNHAIRKITPAGVVTTFAGTLGASGYADGARGVGRLNAPRGIVRLADGSLVVLDGNNSALRRVDASGNLTTVAGSSPSSAVASVVDGAGTAARFAFPVDLTVDASGNLYVADGANIIRRVDPSYNVTTLAGLAYEIGFADGTGSAARFNNLRGIAWDQANARLIAVDGFNTIRTVSTGGVVATFAGVPPGSEDGTGIAARFYAPAGLVLDAGGALIVADSSNHILRKVTPSGVVTTFSGVANYSTAIVNGPAASARFALPQSIARHPVTGDFYVFDGYNIRKVAVDGTVSAFVGPGNFTSGSSDGVGPAARFGFSGQLAFAPNGDLYVADQSNHTIRKVTADGTVTTVAGVAGSAGAVNGSVAGGASTSPVRFNNPRGIAVDASGTIYVAQNYSVRKIDPAGTVTTFVGSDTSNGQFDGAPPAARLGVISTLALGPDGQLYVGVGSALQRVNPITGVVTTLAGNLFVGGFLDSAGPAARADMIAGIAVAADGTVYFSDSGNGVIRRATAAPAITFTTQPSSRAAPLGSTVTFTGAAIASGSLTYQWTKDGVDLPGQNSATLTLGSVTAADVGAYALRVTVGSASALSQSASLTLVTAEAYDGFARPAVLTGRQGSLTTSNVNASGESGEPVYLSTVARDSSVWLAWTAPATGRAVFDTFGSTTNTAMAVYTGDSFATLAFLTDNNDAAGTFQSRVTFPATAGQTYRIAVGTSTGSRGSITVNYGLMVLPSPGIQAVAYGQPASFSVALDPAATPPLSTQWRHDGNSLTGATASTLAFSAVGFSDAGGYQPALVQSGQTNYDSSAPGQLLVTSPGSQHAVDAFAGTALSNQWTLWPNPVATSRFEVGERLTLASLDTNSYSQSRTLEHALRLPLDRNWTSVVRVEVNPADIPSLVGTGSVRSAGIALGVSNANNESQRFEIGLHAANATGTPVLEVRSAVSFNQEEVPPAPVVTVGQSVMTVRLEYNVATGLITSSVSAGGAFTPTKTVSPATAWGMVAGGTLRLMLRGTAELVVLPSGALAADDFGVIVQPVRPVITTQPASRTVNIGDTVDLSVTATGAVTYQWYRNGTAVPLGDAATLSLTNVSTGIAGTYTVDVANGGGTTSSQPAVLSVNALPAYESWLLTTFTTQELANPMISGPGADPDRDGLPNLLEYALGLAPKLANTSGLPAVAASATEWTYTYTRPSDRSDVTYVVERSTTLTSWTTADVIHELVATNTGAGTQTWRARVPLSAGANLFFRLKVTVP